MKIQLIATSLIASMALLSCAGDTAQKTDEATTNTCFYEYENSNAVSFKWTAYKTSEKVAVSGTFNSIVITGGEKSTKLPEVLQAIKFSIPVESTNTTNPDRDSKIVNSFFGAMLNTDLIVGQASTVNGDNEKGDCSFLVNLNGIEKEVKMNYTVSDSLVKLVGDMNLENWDGKTAMDSLNKVCGELHKGKDGVSVLWPDVKIEIEVAITKRCH
ncbi:MAG: YceI family protein [Flavobacteriales bacterium]|nr:YceI family protein [Flavobacteriales bacterium]